MNAAAFTCSKPKAADFLKDGSPSYLLCARPQWLHAVEVEGDGDLGV